MIRTKSDGASGKYFRTAVAELQSPASACGGPRWGAIWCAVTDTRMIATLGRACQQKKRDPRPGTVAADLPAGREIRAASGPATLGAVPGKRLELVADVEFSS